MKKIALITFMISITILSFGQRKIKKLEVIEKGYNINIEFNPVIDEIVFNELKFKIVPISADELNSLFLKESSINGKFEYTYYDNSRNSYFLKKRKKKREKSDFEFLFEGVEWLIDNEKINQQEYDELVKQIIFNYDKEAGDEIYSTDRIISSNPYYIQNRYLSVFKIEISNPTKSYLTFDENITIQSGNSIYRPLPSKFIIKELQKSNLMNVDKALTLERHNLPDSISIPPNSKFEKLFAVLPIDYNNKILEISFSGINSKFKWEIIKDETIINELYTFYEFNIDWEYSGIVKHYADNFNVLKKSNQSSVFLGNNELFIGEENLNEVFEIFTLSLYGATLYYGRNSNLKGIDFINKEKTRRKTITIRTNEISVLKKKVKQ